MLLLTSCTGIGNNGAQVKGMNAHAKAQTINIHHIVCDSDAPGSGYEDALDAIKNSPKY